MASSTVFAISLSLPLSRSIFAGIGKRPGRFMDKLRGPSFTRRPGRERVELAVPHLSQSHFAQLEHVGTDMALHVLAYKVEP
jgi:hypothetical protein